MVLVTLMVALVAFLLWQVASLNRELRIISEDYQRLEHCLLDLNESGLRQRLAFERWTAALISIPPRTEVILEAEANFETFTLRVQEDIKEAANMRALTVLNKSGPAELAQIRAMLGEIDATHRLLEKRQRDVLGRLQQGHLERTTDMISMMDDIHGGLQERRHQVQVWVEDLVQRSLHEATEKHQRIVWTTVAMTVASVFLAVVLAALVTQRLVRPVRSLITGISTVEKGDLTVELPVQSGDEVGTLTKSFNFFINELRMKEEMRNAFGKYIDPRILERVLLRPGAVESVVGKQEMAVSFADLAGFTGIGELLTPAAVVNLLNSHFSLQADAVQRHQGVIDKFIGDAVMAFWGIPFTKEGEHAALACSAALDQVQALEKLERMLPEITGLRKNLPHLSQRIGISTGEVVAGSIGSDNARSYTVIGDTVNLASRLEQANRFYGTNILICQTTRLRAGEHFLAREIDLIVVKGKSESTRIYELLGMREHSAAERVALVEAFSAALASYRERDWDRAEIGFRKCLDLWKNDAPSLLFLERINTFRKNPPSNSWTGEWVFDAK